MAYIYKIYNDINDKLYIGQTNFDLNKRFKAHCSDAHKAICANRPLYKAMLQYGFDKFHIECIEETDNPNEREVYWINVLDTFHNGYNATYGGEGKHFIDYDLVISTYQKIQNINDTANILHIHPDSVTNILNTNNIEIIDFKQVLTQKYGKSVDMYELDGTYLRSFQSINEAARYMVNNGLTKCKHTTIKQHITEVCNGKRKTASKYKWHYSN